MVALRLIPCLDVANGRVVKGVNFVNLRDSGDPVELACRYSEEGADELVFLDIRASVENRNTLVDLVSRTAKSVKIPFTVGGGIDSVSSIYDLLRAGADKVSLKSSAEEFKLTLSAPALKRSLIEETESIPPPTVKGIFTDFAVLETRSTNAVSYTHLTLPTTLNV